VLYERAEYAKSRAVLEEGLRILDPETMSETIVETHWKLSRTCLAVGDIPSARTFARAAAANVAPTDRYSKVTTTAALGAVDAAEGNAAEAEAHYREALDAVGITGYRALRADLERSFGEFLLRQGRTDDARVLLLSARIFYANEATDRRRADLDVLLARCGPLKSTVQTAGD
jgi:tetratricopeptide (TPR) repeat protein